MASICGAARFVPHSASTPSLSPPGDGVRNNGSVNTLYFEN
jgi:hypothetical protein